MDTGVLRRLEGEEQEFLNRNGSSDVLYTINRSILAAILNVSRSASTIEEDVRAKRAGRLIDDPTPNTEDERNQSI